MLVSLACLADPAAAGYRVVRGTAEVSEATGENRWTNSPHCRHRYLEKTMADQYYVADLNAKLV